MRRRALSRDQGEAAYGAAGDPWLDRRPRGRLDVDGDVRRGPPFALEGLGRPRDRPREEAWNLTRFEKSEEEKRSLGSKE